MKTVILHLIGLAGTGKYTIAREIAAQGYTLVDNHLINNPILSLIDKRDGATRLPGSVWYAIACIREAVFDFIMQQEPRNYIFTNELLKDCQRNLSIVQQIEEIAVYHGAIFVPVILTISQKERARRIASSGRAERLKQTVLDEKTAQCLIELDHQNLYQLDVTKLSAHQAAENILEHVATLLVE